jgi:hypothetical protein
MTRKLLRHRQNGVQDAWNPRGKGNMPSQGWSRRESRHCGGVDGADKEPISQHWPLGLML